MATVSVAGGVAGADLASPLQEIGALPRSAPIPQGSQFGRAIAVSGDGLVIVVGAPTATAGDCNEAFASDFCGSVLLYERVGDALLQRAELVSPFQAHNSEFGHAVAVSADGEWVAVGQPGLLCPVTIDYEQSCGAAYLFQRSAGGWSLHSTLMEANDAIDEGDNFGEAVALSADGSTLAVGNRNDSEVGSVSIFTRSGTAWSFQQKLPAPDPSNTDNFGHALALSADGDVLLAGAPFSDVAGTNEGRAYFFLRSFGTHTLATRVEGGAQSVLLGIDVALSATGDSALIATGLENGTHGGVQEWTRVGASWTAGADLPSQVPVTFTGDSVVALSADGTAAVVGVTDMDCSTPLCGEAHLYQLEQGAWAHVQQLLPAFTAASPHDTRQRGYGGAVALSDSGRTALVGAALHDCNGVDSGCGDVWAFGDTDLIFKSSFE